MINVGGHGVLEKHETAERLRVSFLRLETHPHDVEALTDIGHSYNVMEQDHLAFEYLEKAVQAQGHPVTWFNYALILRQYGRHEEAFPYIEKAHNAWPWNMFMGHVYAEELIRQGKWLEAWPLCSRYRYTKNWCAPAGVEEWKGQDINGKRLAVITEGGRGDAIWLYRFLPKLAEMGAIVTFHTIGELAALFKENPILFYPKDTVFYSLEHPYDYWVSIFELLQWLEVKEPYWPGVYIKAKPAESKGNVGLCWSAGEKLDVRKHRSLSDEQADQLCSYSGVRWQSLQYGYDFEPKDWAETAKVVAGLDLVITVDTAMVHLAGAMGKPTWLILGGYQDCKWGAGETTGWYPSVKIFRNSSSGFNDVLPRIEKELDKFAKEEVII